MWCFLSCTQVTKKLILQRTSLSVGLNDNPLLQFQESGNSGYAVSAYIGCVDSLPISMLSLSAPVCPSPPPHLLIPPSQPSSIRGGVSSGTACWSCLLSCWRLACKSPSCDSCSRRRRGRSTADSEETVCGDPVIMRRGPLRPYVRFGR